MFLLYVVFTLVHNNIQSIQDTHYCKNLMQTNKLSYAGAGSEINSRGHKNFHWQMNKIHNIYLS